MREFQRLWKDASTSERLQFLVARAAVGALGASPRRVAHACGSAIAWLAYRSLRRLRRVGLRNLEIAFPGMPLSERRSILRAEFSNLGRMLVESSRMPSLTRRAAEQYVRYDGLDRYLRARAKGKGVLVLTAHLGVWELSSFFHSLAGYPMGMVIRRLDNSLVDAWINRVRCLHGNRVLHKDDFARGLLAEMRAGHTVGILMDTNMTPPQGVFVPFFGVAACTASGLARVAQKTGATVLPGFLFMEPDGRYRLHFGEEIEVVRTMDTEADALENTKRFTAVLEDYIRRYPGQWLWLHRRWKTRPEGEARIYE